jgi:hypothetical protein
MYLPKCFVSIESIKELNVNTAVHQDLHYRAKSRAHANPERLFLGYGFLHFSLVRAARPRHIVVPGLGFGFNMVSQGLGTKDNGEGSLCLPDPG